MSETSIKKEVEDGMEQYFFRASAEDFKKIPGSPIAYWVSKGIINCFDLPKVSSLAEGEGKNVTADNDVFLRKLWEVSAESVGLGYKWLLYSKGGPFRKWSGNLEFVVNWSSEARQFYRKNHSSRIIDEKYWYRPGITWTDITSFGTGFRYLPKNTTYDTTGISFFLMSDKKLVEMLSVLNSKPCLSLMPVINPTLHANLVDIKSLPVPNLGEVDESIGMRCIELSDFDWGCYETSSDFADIPLLKTDYRQPDLKATYQNLRTHWQKMTEEMQRLEQENNRIFIEAYGLQDELTPEVPLKEITLTCNPYYRYGKVPVHEKHERHEKEENIVRDFRAVRGQKDFPIDEELEARLLADSMNEFISYAVGCMFGRYALDKPGLILANQGETIEDYYNKLAVHEKHERHEKEENDVRDVRGQMLFPADEDNVIPILDGDWFTDDITERFFKFLRITFGDEYFEDNLKFIEQAIGKDVRKYFLKDFYTDHVKRYKKRPIYWLFSSSKGSFNALIYMHRYRPDTVSVVLNDYLREFCTKLTSRKNHLEAVSISASASQSEKTKALKEIEKLNKMIAEMKDYEREVLYPLATEQVEIDLDDGVKVNYNKFSKALKKIVGLTGK